MLEFKQVWRFQVIVVTHAAFHNRKFEPLGITSLSDRVFIPQINNKSPMLLAKQNGFCLNRAPGVLAQIDATRPIKILLIRALALAAENRLTAVVDI